MDTKLLAALQGLTKEEQEEVFRGLQGAANKLSSKDSYLSASLSQTASTVQDILSIRNKK